MNRRGSLDIRTKKSWREGNSNCPTLNQWHWLRHMAKRGRDEALSKVTSKNERAEIIGSLISIDAWLEAKFCTRFEIPLAGHR